MIPQIDKDQLAVVALAVDPAGEPYLLTDIGFGKFGAVVRTIGMHDEKAPDE
jgi:hypothetical protein